MKKSLIYIVLFASNFMFAQQEQIPGSFGISSGVNNLLSDDFRNLLNSKPKTVTDSDIEGSIFFDKEYRTAKVTGVQESWPIRYDAYRDEIEVKKNNEVFALKKDPAFNEIIFTENNKKIILAEYDFNKKEQLGYLFEVLSTPNFALYKKNTIVFKKGKEPKTTLEIATPNRFIASSPTYFIKDSNGAAFIEVDKKAKNIIASSPEKKSKVKKCLKESNLNLNQELTVKNFAKCINS